MAEGRPEPVWLSVEAVLALHAEQITRFGGLHGVRDEAVLESAVARPRHVFHYRPEADVADLAAALLVGLAGRQAFVDGNKRTGAAAMLVFLWRQRAPLHVPAAELFAVVMGVATGRLKEDEVAAWVQRGL